MTFWLSASIPTHNHRGLHTWQLENVWTWAGRVLGAEHHTCRGTDPPRAGVFPNRDADGLHSSLPLLFEIRYHLPHRSCHWGCFHCSFFSQNTALEPGTMLQRTSYSCGAECMCCPRGRSSCRLLSVNAHLNAVNISQLFHSSPGGFFFLCLRGILWNKDLRTEKCVCRGGGVWQPLRPLWKVVLLLDQRGGVLILLLAR